MPTVARALRILGRVGGPGPTLAADLDLLRSMGPRDAARHWRRRSAAVRSSLDRAQEKLYRKIWSDAAAAVGADEEQMGGGFLLLRRGSARTIVWRYLVMIDHQLTQRLSTNKPLCQRLLANAGLPVPQSLTFDSTDLVLARAFVERSSGPCVVKPAGQAAGTGVTCGVESQDDLERAAVSAARWDRQLLIERQAKGAEYRVLVLDGQILGAVRRRAAQVYGDGRSSVGALIEAENEQRFSSGWVTGARVLRVDLDSLLTLRRAGFSLGSVPSEGTVVTVKTSVHENRAEDNETVTHVSEHLAGDVRRAAAALELRLAGVDLVTSDLSTTLDQSGGAILEVNNPPGLHFHYHVADPETLTPVAVPILESLLAGKRKERTGE